MRSLKQVVEFNSKPQETSKFPPLVNPRYESSTSTSTAEYRKRKCANTLYPKTTSVPEAMTARMPLKRTYEQTLKTHVRMLNKSDTVLIILDITKIPLNDYS